MKKLNSFRDVDVSGVSGAFARRARHHRSAVVGVGGGGGGGVVVWRCDGAPQDLRRPPEERPPSRGRQCRMSGNALLFRRWLIHFSFSPLDGVGCQRPRSKPPLTLQLYLTKPNN